MESQILFLNPMIGIEIKDKDHFQVKSSHTNKMGSVKD